MLGFLILLEGFIIFCRFFCNIKGCLCFEFKKKFLIFCRLLLSSDLLFYVVFVDCEESKGE